MKGLDNIRSQLNELNENALTIPNLLSMLRIVVVPIFVYLFLAQHYKGALFVIFISGLTDLFDGKIARRFNQISKLGKVLDPAADKLTQIALAILLFMKFNESDEKVIKAFSYVFIIFFVKEALMIFLSFVLMSMDLAPQVADIWGKTATFSFYMAMGFLLMFAPDFGAFKEFFVLPNELMMGMVIAVAVLTVIAFFAYGPATLKAIEEKKTKQPDLSNNKTEIATTQVK